MSSTLLGRGIPPGSRLIASPISSASRTIRPYPLPNAYRIAASSSKRSPSHTPPPDQPPDQPPYTRSPLAVPPRSPITNWVLASPQRTAFLLKIGDWLGYGSPKQVAARRAKTIYDVCAEVARGEERAFWYNALSLPPTLQSWFTITNLHIWLATVRLRAVPAPHGRYLIQALIDHFFFDVEDRLRAVLGKKAPERVVTRHMKILREQWTGLGLALDHALISGDKDMASAVWRNLLGARGARGIAYDTQVEGATTKGDDASGGVVDFEGPSIQKYVLYPELMLALTAYARHELVRLQDVSDADILGSQVRDVDVAAAAQREVTALREVFRFASLRDTARVMGVEIQV